MAIRLLGDLQVSVAGQAVAPAAWRLRKARALVALLALAPGYRLHREAAQEVLWPESHPNSVANNLRQALHAARRAIGTITPAGPWLQQQGELLVLGPAAALQVDVVAFEAALAAAQRGADLAAWWAALDQYTGELLPEAVDAEWVTARREALRERYLAALVELAERHVGRGEDAAALLALGRAIKREPAHEPARRALMLLHARGGRPEAAADQYRQLRAALALVEAMPEPATEQLYQAILAAWSGAPARSAGNLPAPIGGFVGRGREITEVRRLLTDTRLLTLTGSGGCGKTRLALEVARAIAGDYPDGVWLVELAALADHRLIAPTVANVLGVREQPGQPATATLVAWLATKHLLVMLDNCEHLADGCAALVEMLLRAGPAPRVLATSRVALGVVGETAWRVPSLSLPAAPGGAAPDLVETAAAEAVQLFRARAAAAWSGFALTEANAVAVAAICRQLDGIPLAIELAAPWARVLPAEVLAARLADSLSLLAGGSQAVPPRQRTLQATLEWTYALLDPAAQALLHRLAVFAGSFTLAAAEVVEGVKGARGPGGQGDEGDEGDEPAPVSARSSRHPLAPSLGWSTWRWWWLSRSAGDIAC